MARARPRGVKRTTAGNLTPLVTVCVFLCGGMVGASVGSAVVQESGQAGPDVEIIPDHSTVLQNESVSLAVQVRNQANSDQFVLVRVFEPHGLSGMRVDGEPPTIPQDNTDMWQSSQTLEPRQRLAVPITIEPGSNPNEHTLRVQVKYFDEGNYTGKSETGVLAVEKCSATCRARDSLAIAFDFFVSYRGALIALLSLVVAALSLLLAVRRSPGHS